MQSGNNNIQFEVRDDEIDQVEIKGQGNDGFIIHCRYIGNDEAFKEQLRGGKDEPEPQHGYYFILKIPKLGAEIGKEQTIGSQHHAKYVNHTCGILFSEGDNGKLFGAHGLLRNSQSHIQFTGINECLAIASNFEYCFAQPSNDAQTDSKPSFVSGDLINVISTIQANISPFAPVTAKNSAFTDDLDINLAQMMYCVYLGMLSLHTENIVHLDIALRNLLISKLKEVEKCIGFSAILADLGRAEILDEDGQVKNLSLVQPLKWSDAKRVQTRTADKTSDLYSFRIALFEAMAVIAGNYQHTFHQILSNPNTRSNEALAVATYVATHGNEVALETYTATANAILQNSNAMNFLDSFSNYINAPMSPETDYELFVNAYVQFFKNALVTRLNKLMQVNNDEGASEEDKQAALHSFLVSVHRMMQPPISNIEVNQLRAEDDLRYILFITHRLQKYGLDETFIHNSSTFINQDVHNLTLLMNASPEKEALKEVLNIEKAYQEQFAQLLAQPDPLAAEIDERLWTDSLTSLQVIEQKILVTQEILLTQATSPEANAQIISNDIILNEINLTRRDIAEGHEFYKKGRELKLLQVELTEKINSELALYTEEKKTAFATTPLNPITAARTMRRILTVFELTKQLKALDSNLGDFVYLQQEILEWQKLFEEQAHLDFIWPEFKSVWNMVHANVLQKPSTHPAVVFVQTLADIANKLGSVTEVNINLQLCNDLKHSSDVELLTAGIETLTKIHGQLVRLREAQENLIDLDIIFAIATLHGQTVDQHQIANAENLLIRATQIKDIELEIKQLSSRQAKLLKKKTEAVDLPGEMEMHAMPSRFLDSRIKNAYDHQQKLISQAKTLVNHFLNADGTLKKDAAFAKRILTAEERLLLEHLLAPYRVLANMPPLAMSKDSSQHTQVLELLFAFINQDDKYQNALLMCQQNQTALLNLIEQINATQATIEMSEDNQSKISPKELVKLPPYYEQMATSIDVLSQDLHDSELKVAMVSAQKEAANRQHQLKSVKVKANTSRFSSTSAFANKAAQIRDQQNQKIKQHAAALLHKIDDLQNSEKVAPKEANRLKASVNMLKKKALRAGKKAEDVYSVKNTLKTFAELEQKSTFSEIEQALPNNNQKPISWTTPAVPQSTPVTELLEKMDELINKFNQFIDVVEQSSLAYSQTLNVQPEKAAEEAEEIEMQTFTPTVSTSQWSLFTAEKEKLDIDLDQYVRETLDLHSLSQIGDLEKPYVTADALFKLLIEMAIEMRNTGTNTISLSSETAEKLDGCPLVERTTDGKYSFQLDLGAELKKYFLAQSEVSATQKRTPV